MTDRVPVPCPSCDRPVYEIEAGSSRGYLDAMSGIQTYAIHDSKIIFVTALKLHYCKPTEVVVHRSAREEEKAQQLKVIRDGLYKECIHVVCPVCNAQPGDKCLNRNAASAGYMNKVNVTPHKDRRVQAEQDRLLKKKK